jgi:hypothetical protein
MLYHLHFASFLLLPGLREWFSQSDESQILPRIPVMDNMALSVSSKKGTKAQDNTVQTSLPVDQSRHSTKLEDESDEDEDEDFQLPESEQEVDDLLIHFPVPLSLHFLNTLNFSVKPSTRELDEDGKLLGIL